MRNSIVYSTIVASLFSLFALFYVIFGTNQERMEANTEMPNQYPSVKYKVMDLPYARNEVDEEDLEYTEPCSTDTCLKEKCVDACDKWNNCNAVQYYSMNHLSESQKGLCRLIKIPKGEVIWKPGSNPMTTVVVKKI